MTPATKRVLDALNNPGPVPGYHWQQVRRLAREWPALYWALRALDDESKEEA